MLILPPKKEGKIGSKEPQNRQHLSYARGLLIGPGSSVVEHLHGKQVVEGSIPFLGNALYPNNLKSWLRSKIQLFKLFGYNSNINRGS